MIISSGSILREILRAFQQIDPRLQDCPATPAYRHPIGNSVGRHIALIVGGGITKHDPHGVNIVGTLNILNAAIASVRDCRIVIDDQRVQVEQIPDVLRENDPVTITLRPEAIALTRGESPAASVESRPAENTLRGTVEDLYFLGSVVRTRVPSANADGQCGLVQ